MDTRLARLYELAGPVCHGAGYDLVELELAGAAKGLILRVFIDHLDPARGPIGFDDCETLSRELGAVLDVEDPLPQAYSLEVSSPGIARPLRTSAHFRRFVDANAKVSLRQGLRGRRNFTGRIAGVSDDDQLVTVEVDGQRFDLPIADVSSARIVPDWDAVMKSSREAAQGDDSNRGAPGSAAKR